MIEIMNFQDQDFKTDAPKELMLLAFISQGFFQPVSLEDNLLAILSALTSGSGVGFNRAMIFLAEGSKLRGKLWLGPHSTEEALDIWTTLSTPGVGYADIIEHNRALVNRPDDSLSRRIQSLSYELQPGREMIPTLATIGRTIVLVRDARNEPRLAEGFRDFIGQEEFLCIPLLTKNEVMGEIILDNAITRAAIEPREIKLASLCGLVAGNAVALARMQKRVTDMERMAALGEMAAFITHELRNPLAAVGGFAEQMTDPRATDRKKKRNLKIIRSEIRRLEDILSKIAGLGKIETLSSPPCHLKPVLESVLAAPETRILMRKRGLVRDIPDGLPAVRCDPVALAQAFRNVVDNALEATPEQGTVQVRCAFLKDAAQVAVFVQDGGTGIPTAIRDKIAQPFFSTKKNGLGLGLVFVRRVMEACGGRLAWESEEGRGAVFSLHFPAETEGQP